MDRLIARRVCRYLGVFLALVPFFPASSAAAAPARVHRPSKVCRHRLPTPRGRLAIACRHRSASGPPPSRGVWLTASPGTPFPALAFGS